MGTTPARLVRPTVGLIAATPFALPGQTMLPSVSLPNDTAAKFADAAAPDETETETEPKPAPEPAATPVPPPPDPAPPIPPAVPEAPPRVAEVTLNLGPADQGRRFRVLVAPAGVAHKFVNSGDGPLRQVDIHVSPSFSTEWLD